MKKLLLVALVLSPAVLKAGDPKGFVPAITPALINDMRKREENTRKHQQEQDKLRAQMIASTKK
jgi:hypothetical protein